MLQSMAKKGVGRMKTQYHKLFTILLIFALIITCCTPLLHSERVYAKQMAPLPSAPLFPMLLARDNNNAGSFTVEGGVPSVDWTYVGTTLKIIKSGTYKIIGDGKQTNENILIDDSFKGTIEISNLNIASSKPPIDIANGTVTLTLIGQNKVLNNSRGGGVQVGERGKLHIKGDGELNAAGVMGVGIGGASGKTFGSITMDSGTIVAVSTSAGAGIGSGDFAPGCGDITINGGNINARASGNGAAIGGSLGTKAACTITINGGTINASTAGTLGAAIGGGHGGPAGSITINGGTIVASVLGYPSSPAAIGSGQENHEAGGMITINGGTIHAIGSTAGTGIGTGSGESDPGIAIAIHGGNITASGVDTGIGNSSDTSGLPNVVITGGTITSTNDKVVSIGNVVGGVPVPSSVMITGGSVKADKIVKPVNEVGNIVYLAKVSTSRYLSELSVDGAVYKRSGMHPNTETNFYLYVTPVDHTIAYHDWKAIANWNEAKQSFDVSTLASDPTQTDVAYDNRNAIPDPDNPTNPAWTLLVPSGITFRDDERVFKANVAIESVNEGNMPNYPVEVQVKSKNGYKLIQGSEKLDYDLQYQIGGTWHSMYTNGTKFAILGTFDANSPSGTTIKGKAILSGIATQTGKYFDTLLFSAKQAGQ